MAPTVFITRVNSGVGLASTKLFLEKGWNVVGTVRDVEAAKELKELASSKDAGELLIVPLDLLKPETLEPALDLALSKFGRVDVLVNNAGYSQYGVIEQLDMDDVRNQFEVNVFGAHSHRI